MNRLHEQIAPPANSDDQLENNVLREHDVEQGIGSIAIDGTGSINITNTGGSSASEGGMGTGGGPEKGAGIQNPTGDSNNTETEEDNSWDPLKPKQEKEKEGDD